MTQAPDLRSLLRQLGNRIAVGMARERQPWLKNTAAGRRVITLGSDRAELRLGKAVHPLSPPYGDLVPLLTKAGKAPIDIVIEAGTGLPIEFDLPGALAQEVAPLVENEIRFNSPFPPERAARVWSATEAAEGWAVSGQLMLKSKITPILDALELAKVPVGQVGHVDRNGLWMGEASFAGETQAARGPLARFRPLWVYVAGLAALVAIGSVLAQSVLLGREQTALDASVLSARATLASASAEQRILRTLVADKSASDLRLSLAGALANILPDTTWLERIEITQDTVEITGYAISAADTTTLVAQIPGLSDVRFSAPVTRDNTQQIERFRIAATLAVDPQ
ncbi:MAG: PilN domain-containing protein [Pseudomonadota bacterium]